MIAVAISPFGGDQEGGINFEIKKSSPYPLKEGDIATTPSIGHSRNLISCRKANDNSTHLSLWREIKREDINLEVKKLLN
ncbi:hypothetical protein [Pedobacter sp.]|uniref:hypothetical protein n=1 Tax=Pedobacter sp. TaxID=1411316 RepID=UPI0031E279BC